MKQHKSKLVKIVKKVTRKRPIKFQNEKNSSDLSRFSKADTESESTDSSALINPRQIKSNVNDTLKPHRVVIFS